MDLHFLFGFIFKKSKTKELSRYFISGMIEQLMIFDVRFIRECFILQLRMTLALKSIFILKKK